MQRFVYLFARLGKRDACVAVPCSGFTLIELLVVVMIIGILSAVVLPQYRTAVNKSRYAGLMPIAKSVKQAEEAMYMANSAYANQLDDLSIKLPGEVNNGGSIGVTIGNDSSKSYVRAVNTKIGNAYVMYFNQSGTYPNEIHCEAKQNNEVAKQICLSYGANPNPLANGTPESTGYDTYVLEGSGIDAVGGPSGGETDGDAGEANTQESYANASLALAMQNWMGEFDDVAYWNCRHFGSECAGYDADGNEIAYASDCNVSNGQHSSINLGNCGSVGNDEVRYFDPIDDGGFHICRETNNTGVCCTDISPSGTCNNYSSFTMLSDDYHYMCDLTNGTCDNWSIRECEGSDCDYMYW